MPRLKVYDLATGTWQYAGGVDPVALATDAAFTSRYPPKPSAGVVYGINQYSGVLAANTALLNTNSPLVTISMPAAPAGSLLDISFTAYMSQGGVGTGSTFLVIQVNAVSVGPTIVVDDKIALMSYSGGVANVAPPVGITYNIVLIGVKATSGGVIQAQGTNTYMKVISYRP